MKKDFKGWHAAKEKIHYQADDPSIYFRERDIWWCRLGANVGFEQDGKGESFSRPVLIIRKFNQFIFWAVPFSGKLKRNPYYIPCACSDGRTRAAMISQLRLISSKRLTDKIGFAELSSFRGIKKAVKTLL